MVTCIDFFFLKQGNIYSLQYNRKSTFTLKIKEQNLIIKYS